MHVSCCGTHQAFNYYTNTGQRLRDDLPNTLVRMHKTGKFIPAAQWIVPMQWRGMDLVKAASMWRIITEPQQTTRDDMLNIYFDKHADRYFDGAIRTRLGYHDEVREKTMLVHMPSTDILRSCSSAMPNMVQHHTCYLLHTNPTS